LKPRRSEAGFVTLIELLVVTVLIIVVVYAVYGRGGGLGGATGVGPEDIGEAHTVPGVALERARGVECEQNLRSIRQAITAYRLENEASPPSLADLRLGISSCPVSHNPYAYDPATGTVRCTTPGHETF
jgi:type II secretory pathway pseudopilin PulG